MAGTGTRRDTPRHLYALDVVRVVTVVSVVAVHSTSVLLPDTSVGGGIGLVLLHTSREIFLLLSAFVLCYSTRARITSRGAFWRRRFPLVVAPYAVWSAIYLVADGDLNNPATVVARYARDLLTAGARYHLYFLLLTFQLYLVFPWLLDWITRCRHQGRLVAVSAGFQLAFTAAAHYRLPLPPPLSTWLTHPGSWLPSYQLFVVVGVVAALQRDRVFGWIQDHAALVLAALVGAVVLALSSYLADVWWAGMTPVRASGVFQPVVVVASLAFAAAEVLLGSRIAGRLLPAGRGAACLDRSSDLSFGVYLGHPLLLQAAVAIGATTWLLRLAPAARLAVLWLVIVPAVVALATVGMAVIRRTPCSLLLTGRRREPSSAAAPARVPTVVG